MALKVLTNNPLFLAGVATLAVNAGKVNAREVKLPEFDAKEVKSEFIKGNNFLDEAQGVKQRFRGGARSFFRFSGRNFSFGGEGIIYFENTRRRAVFIDQRNRQPFEFYGVTHFDGRPCPIIGRGGERFIIIDNNLYPINGNRIVRQPITNVTIVIVEQNNNDYSNNCRDCNDSYSYNSRNFGIRDSEQITITAHNPHQARISLIRELERRGYNVSSISQEDFDKLIHFTPYDPVPNGGVIVIEDNGRVSVRGHFGNSNNDSGYLSEFGRSFPLAGNGASRIFIGDANGNLLDVIDIQAGRGYSRKNYKEYFKGHKNKLTAPSI